MRIMVRTGCPKELSLAPNRPGEIGQAIGVDPGFDLVVRGSGPPDQLRPLSVGPGRLRIMDAMVAGCRLDNGTVWWTGPIGTPTDELQRICALLLGFADALAGTTVRQVPAAVPGKDARKTRTHALRQTALLAGKRASELDPSEVRAMLDDPDARVAVAAARSLSDTSALWALAEAEDPARRVVALVALAEVGADPRRVERGLLQLLEMGVSDSEVVEAIGAVGSADAIAPLRALVGFGLNARGRAALDAIGRIQSRSGL
ncbi:MAG: hypothetical protein KC621_26820, partial [Myxococcales bacterium]|nr:hypothetical protein [Myxococcales bacterium]